MPGVLDPDAGPARAAAGFLEHVGVEGTTLCLCKMMKTAPATLKTGGY